MIPITKIKNIYYLREDQNITGSAKDRAIPFQINQAIKLGYQKFVIASSGNAAISADYFCRQLNLELQVFVSPHISASKLSLIKSQVTKTTQPNSSAFKYAKQNQAFFLRQSTDPNAQIGYQKITIDILTQLPQVTSIFLPIGSGTTLLGISKNLPKNIKLFGVQPASSCPICSYFDQDYTSEMKTITDALSVKLLPNKQKIISLLKNHGGGVVVNDSEVKSCYQELLDNQLFVSPEAGLALAGLKKVSQSLNIGDYPLIIVTGIKR
ncbi:MAG TPA: PLP-dependent lyase/thiolase [Candidatus Woesebacteria bacterium]|nr:PLP-dependent lyase/thiolase [Candidatus Woesebacteria bacterium]HPJ17052.1 PLP-dependent lyase/thiolase [Candidatus Woesebacteria bacterium]